MSKIVETIHHGNYRNTRTMHIHPVTREGLSSFIHECPYLAPGADFRLVADKLHMIATSPAGKGSLDVGWVHWEVSE